MPDDILGFGRFLNNLHPNMAEGLAGASSGFQFGSVVSDFLATRSQLDFQRESNQSRIRLWNQQRLMQRTLETLSINQSMNQARSASAQTADAFTRAGVLGDRGTASDVRRNLEHAIIKQGVLQLL